MRSHRQMNEWITHYARRSLKLHRDRPLPPSSRYGPSRERLLRSCVDHWLNGDVGRRPAKMNARVWPLPLGPLLGETIAADVRSAWCRYTTSGRRAPTIAMLRNGPALSAARTDGAWTGADCGA